MTGSVHHVTWTILISSAISVGLADYTCLCSYAVDFPLYSRPDVNSAIIDHLYEFDCKPQYLGTTGSSTNWKTVMTNHQIGYIQNSNSVSKEICRGNIPIDDKVTTTQSTTPTMPPSTTTVTPMTSQQQANSTSSSKTSGGTAKMSQKPSSYTTDSAFTVSTFSGPNSPSTMHIQSNTSSGKPMTGQSNPSTVLLLTTTKAPPSSSSVTSNLISTKPTSVQQTKTVSSVPVNQKTTNVPKYQSTTLSTTVKSTTTTKSTPVTTTKPSTTRQVTTTVPTTTVKPSKPSTRRTTRHYIPPVTQAPAYHTTYHCPNNVISAARHNHGTTGVYGSICYELVPYGYTWKSAESNCKNKGGHLVHIRNPTEETNVMRFLHDSRYTNHVVWLGLTDLHHENTFYWSSGDSVTYTKWLPGHTNNFYNHNYEDCVVLIPFKKGYFLGTYGVWDDTNCLQTHSWICQYNAIPSQHWIHSIFGHGGHHAANNNHIVFTTNRPLAGALGNALDLIGRK